MVKFLKTLFYFFRTMIFWVFFIVTALIMYFVLFIPRKFQPLKVARYTAKLMSKIIMLYLWLFCGIKIKVESDFDLNKLKSNIIITNHQSDFETFFLCLLVPDARFIIKKELLSIPFFGPVLRDCGYISIDRKGGAKSLIQMINKTNESLKLGDNIIIFPQGTRTKLGQPVKLLSGVLGIIKKCDAPIAIAIHNSGQHWLHNNFYFNPGIIKFEFIKPKIEYSNKNELSLIITNHFEELMDKNNANTPI